MTLTRTILGYCLLPIGLLLILMIEPGRVLTFRRKNMRPADVATALVISI